MASVGLLDNADKAAFITGTSTNDWLSGSLFSTVGTSQFGPVSTVANSGGDGAQFPMLGLVLQNLYNGVLQVAGTSTCGFVFNDGDIFYSYQPGLPQFSISGTSTMFAVAVPPQSVTTHGGQGLAGKKRKDLTYDDWKAFVDYRDDMRVAAQNVPPEVAAKKAVAKAMQPVMQPMVQAPQLGMVQNFAQPSAADEVAYYFQKMQEAIKRLPTDTVHKLEQDLQHEDLAALLLLH